MNANTFLSYMKSKPIRIKIFVPFEFWALGPTAVGLALATLVFFISTGWGTVLYTATGICFLLANTIRNIESSDAMLRFIMNKPANKVDGCGVKFVIPFVTLCDYIKIHQVDKDGMFEDVETSDGLCLTMKYLLNIVINDNLVYIYGQKTFRGTEPTVMKTMVEKLNAAVKDTAKRYIQRSMIKKGQEAAFKKEAEDLFLKEFGDYLEKFSGHRDLYTVILTLSNFKYDPALIAELADLTKSEVSVEIAENDAKATVIDAKAEADARKHKGEADAYAQELLYQKEKEFVEELKKQLGSSQAVADYLRAKNSNLTIDTGGKGGTGTGIIIDPRGGK
jgi:hypothetical protein